MDYHIGDHVRYKHHYPGDTWDDHIWWICGKTTDEADWRPPVIFYRVARLDDPEALCTVRTCVREDMLSLAQERYIHE